MKKILIIILYLSSVGLNGQKYQQKIFEYSKDYWPSIIIKDSNNYLIAGIIFDSNNEMYPVRSFLFTISNTLGILDTNIYQDESGYLFYRDVKKIDNSYIIASESNVPFFRELDKDKNIVGDYILEYDSLKEKTLKTLTISEEGNIWGGGYTRVNGNDDYPYLCVLNKEGELLWDTSYYDFPPNSGMIDIYFKEETNKKYITFYVGYSQFSKDGLLWEIDNKGNKIKAKQFNYGATDGIRDLIFTKDGNILLFISSFSVENYRRIIKLNLETWLIDFEIKDYFQNNEVASLMELEDSSIVAFGSFQIKDATVWDHLDDYQLVKLDKQGNLLWNRIYITDEDDFPIKLFKTEDDGFMLAGYNWDGLIHRLHLIKTNCMGLLTEPECSFEYNNLGSQEVAFTNTSLYVYPDSIDGGYYEWDFGDGSALSNEVNPVHTYTEEGEYQVRLTGIVCSDTSIYEQTVLATPTSVDSPASFSLEDAFRLYPNPVESILYFEVGGNYAGQQGRILFYNTLGQLTVQSTFHNKVDVGDLPGGVYFVVVEIGGERIVEKVTIIGDK